MSQTLLDNTGTGTFGGLPGGGFDNDNGTAVWSSAASRDNIVKCKDDEDDPFDELWKPLPAVDPPPHRNATSTSSRGALSDSSVDGREDYDHIVAEVSSLNDGGGDDGLDSQGSSNNSGTASNNVNSTSSSGASNDNSVDDREGDDDIVAVVSSFNDGGGDDGVLDSQGGSNNSGTASSNVTSTSSSGASSDNDDVEKSIHA